MLEIDPAHPIFRDFKNVRMHAKVRICYQPGLGGNWVGSQLFGKIREMDSVNEYNADGIFFTFETFDWTGTPGCMSPIIDLDKAYSLVKYMVGVQENLDGINLILSHDLPFISPRIFDYHAGQTISIEAGKDSSWFTYLLSEGKNHLNTSYMDKKPTIAWLLSDNPATGSIDVETYDRIALDLSAKLNGSMWLINTPITWKWVVRCVSDGSDPTDLDAFRSYCTSTIIPKISNTRDGGIPSLLGGIYSSQSYLSCKQGLGDSVIETFDYGNLFFDLRLPKDGVLAGIDRSLLAAYTNDNMRLANRILTLLTDDCREMLGDLLGSTRIRLQRALLR